MRLALTNETGDVRNIDVPVDMELVNLKALVEAEFEIPTDQQIIFHNGREQTDDAKTLRQLGIVQDDILLVRSRQPRPDGGARASGAQAGDPAEVARQQIISNPTLLRQLTSQNPGLANAAINNPAEFRRLFNELNQRRREWEEQQRRQRDDLTFADPFDIEAQRRIEEEIRKQNINENMETAMEYNPESFGTVVMLYINCEVNGHPVKAFVDSGAQATIMSPECAKYCNVMHLLDERFAGIAQGVGTAKILGRIHNGQMKVGNTFLPCAFNVMENQGVDLLFGLDMLKRHQACIDLKNNLLRIGDEVIPFLPEHELPERARLTRLSSESPVTLSAPPAPAASSSSSAPAARPAGPLATTSSKYPESSIKTLMDLGASREEAIGALDACGGNTELAANMLFAQ